MPITIDKPETYHVFRIKLELISEVKRMMGTGVNYALRVISTDLYLYIEDLPDIEAYETMVVLTWNGTYLGSRVAPDGIFWQQDLEASVT